MEELVRQICQLRRCNVMDYYELIGKHFQTTFKAVIRMHFRFALVVEVTRAPFIIRYHKDTILAC